MNLIVKALKSIGQSLLHFTYPPLCFSCQQLLSEPDILCSTCQNLMELLDPTNRCPLCFNELSHQSKTICVKCQKQPSIFDGTAAAFEYSGPPAALVKKVKYSNFPFLVEGLSAFLAAQLMRLEWPMPDLIIPVPITFTHWVQRGYNQSLLLAEELGLLINRPVHDIIHRAVGDYSQAGLSKAQRLNLSSANFSLKKVRNVSIQDKCVLIIDDVMTTGSTLNNCAKVLMQECPSKLYALTVCKSL